MKRELFRLQNITKSFAGIKVLNEVDLSVFAGEILGLIGENGAGKSTLIKIFCGFLSADSGKIYKNEKRITISGPAQARISGIHYVLQEPAVVTNMTVAENIFLYSSYHSYNPALRKSRIVSMARELFERLDIDINPEMSASMLTMSEKYLLEVAMAVSTESSVLILDEATAAMNMHDAMKVMRIISDYKAGGGAVVYISHNVDDVLKIADRIEVLREGETVGILRKKDFSKSVILKLLTGMAVLPGIRKSERSQGKEILKIENACVPDRISDFSLTLHEGEILGVTGIIGAGKSHVARIIFGLEKISSGSIYIDNIKQVKYSSRKALAARVAYIPEDRLECGIFSKMSVEDNMTVSVLDRISRLGFISTRLKRYVTSHYMKKLSIVAAGIGSRAETLSGGNQQKVIISRWMATNPRMVIADEPTNGLDIASKIEVMSLLRDMADSGAGVLIIASDFRNLTRICDRVMVMKKGTVISEFGRGDLLDERIISDMWVDE